MQQREIHSMQKIAKSDRLPLSKFLKWLKKIAFFVFVEKYHL